MHVHPEASGISFNLWPVSSMLLMAVVLLTKSNMLIQHQYMYSLYIAIKMVCFSFKGESIRWVLKYLKVDCYKLVFIVNPY